MEIPGYTLQRELGRGGMATVYLALQNSLDRQVALKVMSPSLINDEMFCKRFIKEGRIAAKLSHPNLLTVFDIGQHEEFYYIASEYLPAGTVRQKMRMGLSADEAAKIVYEIAQGLAFAHSQSFVHRDVKPGNLLFRSNGTCVLADFGIAKGLNSNTIATKAGTSIGTPHYMSPEQARGDKVDGRTDLYSLGVVWFEMLVGNPPFQGENAFAVALSQVNDPVPQLPAHLRQYQGLINKLLEKSADKRPADAQAFLQLFEQQLGRPGRSNPGENTRKPPQASAGSVRETPNEPYTQVRQTPTAQTVIGSSQPNRSSRNLLLGLLVVVILAGGGGAAWWFYRDSAPASASPQNTDQATAVTEPNETQSFEQTARDDEKVAALASPPGQESETIAQEPTTAEVAALLTQADAYFDAAQYAYPRGENATESYQAVLQLDPDNARARARLSQLAEIWADAAENSIADGNYTMAENLINRGLLSDPDNTRLLQLQEQVAEQQ